MQNILSVRKLTKVYSNGTHALKGVSFDVKKGEFLVIIGLSGSGKSTLLRCLNQLHEPTTGEIQFDGKTVFTDQMNAASTSTKTDVHSLRKDIGMIFQHFNLIPRHSVLSNVLMGTLGKLGTLQSIFGFFPEEDRKKALQYLDLVGIKEKAKMRADNLSGGQQQRVAIARALTQNPKILLADEPVASLDPATCHSVMNYLRKVNQELGITVIANLHFLSLVREYATRVIALKSGEIVFEGSPSEINDEWFKQIYGEGAKEVYVH